MNVFMPWDSLWVNLGGAVDDTVRFPSRCARRTARCGTLGTNSPQREAL
jgi:hypothetical protein